MNDGIMVSQAQHCTIAIAYYCAMRRLHLWLTMTPSVIRKDVIFHEYICSKSNSNLLPIAQEK